jgi:hypothetical protein
MAHPKCAMCGAGGGCVAMWAAAGEEEGGTQVFSAAATNNGRASVFEPFLHLSTRPHQACLPRSCSLSSGVLPNDHATCSQGKGHCILNSRMFSGVLRPAWGDELQEGESRYSTLTKAETWWDITGETLLVGATAAL